MNDGTIVWTDSRITYNGLGRTNIALDVYDANGGLLARYPERGEIPKGETAVVSGPHLLVHVGERLAMRRLPDLRLVRTFIGVRGPMPKVNQDGRRAAAIDDRGVLRVWSDGPSPSAAIPTGLVATRIGSGASAFTDPPSCLLSPDGTRILGYDRTHRFKVWDLRSLRLVSAWSVTPLRGDFAHTQWSPTSSAVLTLSDRKGLVDYDLASGTSRTVLLPNASAAQSPVFPAFSPNGRLVAFSLDDVVEIRSARTGRRLFTLDTRLPGENPGSIDQIRGIAFSRDGHRLSVLYYDGRLRVFRDDH